MTGRCIAPSCKDGREIGAVFCATHLKAPPAQRGGWLSAERRRRELAASKETALDASNIVKRLWVGSEPPFDRDLPEFDTLVLCARELQPAGHQLAFGRQVIRAPIPDSALSNDELRTALAQSRHVAIALADQKRVLVTCRAGLNRSAFIASLALGIVSRLGPADIIELMRTRRAEAALHNPHFCEYIHRYVGAMRAKKPSATAPTTRR